MTKYLSVLVELKIPSFNLETITFSKKYTRPGIDPFWFYCIDSNNVKLLPTMLVEKAKARLSGSIEEYNNVINKLCNTQGQISDDGESWIDKYSGYVIKKIDNYRIIQNIY